MERTRPQHIEDLNQQSSTVTSRTADIVSEMSESASENVRRVTSGVTDNVHRAAEYFRGNNLQNISEDVLDYAKANPAQALIAAAIAGFVVGRLIASRSPKPKTHLSQ